MAFDFASAKTNLRRVVQNYFGVDAFYKDASLSVPEPLRVRHIHKKEDRYGDIVETGYADVTENIERIVFYPSDTPALTFVSNGRVTLPSLPGVEFILRLRDPATNAQEQSWQVVRA